MQENINKEFDLMVRSMMQDAQEEVPSGVWDRIMDGLASSSPAPVVVKSPTKIPFWGRIAIGMAAAAAAVAAVLFIPGGSSVGPDSENQIISVVGEPQVPVEVLPEEVQEEVPSVVPSTRKLVSQILTPSAPQVETESEGIPSAAEILEGAVSEENYPAVQPVSSPTTESTGISDTRPESKEVVSEPSEGPDPFAVMEWEDSRKSNSRPVALTLGGDVQSNGNASPTMGRGPFRAPGTVPTKTTIEEVSKESNYAIPFSVGLGVRFYVAPKLSVGTGLTYSFLERTFNGNYIEVKDGNIVRSLNADIRHQLHYVGVPLNIYYDVFSGRLTDIYVMGGGSLEKAIANKYQIPDASTYSGTVKGVQASAAAGIGLQLKISPHLGVYLDPSIRYYFDDNQPTSIRTQQPVLFNLEAGLRFNLGK